NGAQNKLELQHGKFNKVIATGTNDQNTLIFTADKASVTAGRNNGASNGTLSAQSGSTITFSSAGNGSSNSSKNVITFQGKTNNTTLASATLTIGSDNAYHTLHTTGGITEINFQTNGSSSGNTIANGTLKGNILSTTGGQTAITFSGNGTIQGSIKSQNGGKNTINLNGTNNKSLDLQATLDATSTGTNTIKLGNNTNGNGTYTIKNSGNGSNGMVTFTGSRSPNGDGPYKPGQNIIEFTKENQTLIIGNGGSGASGNGGILTTGGETLINMSKGSTIQLATLEATGTNGQQYAENIISLNGTPTARNGETYTIKNGDTNGTVTFKGNNHGFNTIKFTKEGQTLKIGDGNGTAKISTESGNTVFELSKTSTIQGTIETIDKGSTRFDFANPNEAQAPARAEENSTSKLNLQGTITAKDGGENIFDFTKKGSYEIAKNGNNGTGAKITAEGTGKNIFSIRDGGETTLKFDQVTLDGSGTHHFSFDHSEAKLTLDGTNVGGVHGGGVPGGFYIAATEVSGETLKTATNTGANISFDFTSGGTLNNSVKTENGSVSSSASRSNTPTTTFTVGAGKTGTVNGSITTTGGTTNIDFSFNNSTLKVGNGTSGTETNSKINTTGGTTNINIKSSDINSTLEVKTITAGAGSAGLQRNNGTTTITFASNVSGSTLNLKGDKFVITTIDKGNGGSNVINLTDSTRGVFNSDKGRKDFRVLEVGGGVTGNGETTVLLYANPHATQGNGTTIGGESVNGGSQRPVVAQAGTTNYGKYAYSDRLIIEGNGASS
ncbi:beta strand repeat-containing protein, partial [Helicobacter pametensis]|uniref:beta strand repeat-containing protein n=1 Tax=Helicobacter pametensis TaxID=95149 RepID=UPI001315A8BB